MRGGVITVHTKTFVLGVNMKNSIAHQSVEQLEECLGESLDILMPIFIDKIQSIKRNKKDVNDRVFIVVEADGSKFEAHFISANYGLKLESCKVI